MRDFLKVAERWYAKANADNDSFDQFVSMWISFNAIYGSQEALYEVNKINNIVTGLPRNVQQRILSLPEVDFFCSLNPTVQYQSMNRDSQRTELRNTEREQAEIIRYSGTNPERALKGMVKILSHVRNNLFHGSKMVHHPRDQEIVRQAYPIVKALVSGYFELHRVEVAEEVPVQEGIRQPVLQNIDVTYLLGQLLEQSRHVYQDLQTLMKQSASKHERNNPIGILLEFDIIGKVLFEDRSIDELKRAQQEALEQYNRLKSEEQHDLDEVVEWVTSRLSEMAGTYDQATSRILNQEYNQLVQKMKQRGYRIH